MMNDKLIGLLTMLGFMTILILFLIWVSIYTRKKTEEEGWSKK